ncbi:MAG: hypothetical protein ACRCTR_02155 [Actinomycetota bacterium]
MPEPPVHPESSEFDDHINADFARIVAHWEAETSSPVARWPVNEDIEHSSPNADNAAPSDLTSANDHPRDRPVPYGPRDWSPADIGGDVEEFGDAHYIPPDPPALPHVSPLLWLAWGGLLGGVLLLTTIATVWRNAGFWWTALGVVAFLAGFALLISRLPHSRPDPHDDGALI